MRLGGFLFAALGPVFHHLCGLGLARRGGLFGSRRPTTSLWFSGGEPLGWAATAPGAAVRQSLQRKDRLLDEFAFSAEFGKHFQSVHVSSECRMGWGRKVIFKDYVVLGAGMQGVHYDWK